MRDKDISPEEFRLLGHQVIDWAADYLKNIEQYPVLSQVSPGDIEKEIPVRAPVKGEDMKDILEDFDNKILKGITHWNHPGFMAYFNSTASVPGILAELFISTLNINGMLWKSSPSSTELEKVTVQWFRDMLGLPEYLWGIIYDTASVSSFHAIASARERALPDLREKGMSSNNFPSIVLYCSEHAHSSIEKGALALGVGLENIRKIATDDKFRMLPGELLKAIKQDKAEGKLPFCVTATVGTTSSTSIDPVRAIGEICRNENIWLHVDSAHAGTAAILPEMRSIMFDGIEYADSLVINPHKWMFTPMDISLLFVKDPSILKRAFSLSAEYLKTSQDTEVINYMDYGIQLGRRFRSLKLWFILRYFGTEGLSSIIRKHIQLGQTFREWILSESEFELMAPVPFSTVCFRAHPKGIDSQEELNKLNQLFIDDINKTGKIFLSHTKLNGNFVIRLVVSGIRTEERHVQTACTLLKQKLQEIKQGI